MPPSELVQRLEGLYPGSKHAFDELAELASAERKFSEAVSQYRGYATLANASKCFFLDTVGELNTSIRPHLVAPLSPNHALLVELTVNAFKALRSAEISALNGYPMQGYAAIRNVYDNCINASAVVQGLTDFEKLAGVSPGMITDAKTAKNARVREEQRVRRLMDGRDCGLDINVVALLKKLDDLFDAETHGSRLSQTFSIGWLQGQEPLEVIPVFSENKVSLYMNRYLETAWLLHRLMPSLQPAGVGFSSEWLRKWQLLDESFMVAVMSLTKQLGKPIGEAFCIFVASKFPFNGATHFPNDI